MVASPANDVIQGSESPSAPVNAARRSIVVNVPVERAYQQWARVEELPIYYSAAERTKN